MCRCVWKWGLYIWHGTSIWSFHVIRFPGTVYPYRDSHSTPVQPMSDWNELYRWRLNNVRLQSILMTKRIDQPTHIPCTLNTDTKTHWYQTAVYPLEVCSQFHSSWSERSFPYAWGCHPCKHTAKFEMNESKKQILILKNENRFSFRMYWMYETLRVLQINVLHQHTVSTNTIYSVGLTLTSPNISTRSWLPLPSAKWYRMSWSMSSIFGFRSLTVPSEYLQNIEKHQPVSSMVWFICQMCVQLNFNDGNKRTLLNFWIKSFRALISIWKIPITSPTPFVLCEIFFNKISFLLHGSTALATKLKSLLIAILC